MGHILEGKAYIYSGYSKMKCVATNWATPQNITSITFHVFKWASPSLTIRTKMCVRRLTLSCMQIIEEPLLIHLDFEHSIAN